MEVKPSQGFNVEINLYSDKILINRLHTPHKNTNGYHFVH